MHKKQERVCKQICAGGCALCPRKCVVCRKKSSLVDAAAGADAAENAGAPPQGFCRAGNKITLACASLHYGEEPPISAPPEGGRSASGGGSGTMFFSHCNLGCAFCQNYQISHEGAGREISEDECAKIMLKLQDNGAININLVTGTPHIPQIISALKQAKNSGLKIPVLWNSSGYETTESILRIDKYIDLYLPDLKTLNSNYAGAWFSAPDYPKAADAAIKKMLELKPNKVIIRHLVIPDYLDSTREALEWFAKNAAGMAELSLMTQYTPVASKYFLRGNLPRRFLSLQEYNTVLSWIEELKIEDGYYQELENDDKWLPDFNKKNPFKSELSKTIWHYSD